MSKNKCKEENCQMPVARNSHWCFKHLQENMTKWREDWHPENVKYKELDFQKSLRIERRQKAQRRRKDEKV